MFDHALEFEVLVRRASQRGWFSLADLCDSYLNLAPAIHAELHNPRKVDIPGMVNALAMFPREWAHSGQILVVPSLAAFPHTPFAGTKAHAAGVLPDGTVLVEAPQGFTSLVDLAAALCLLQHEVQKADELLPPDLRPGNRDEQAWDEDNTWETPRPAWENEADGAEGSLHDGEELEEPSLVQVIEAEAHDDQPAVTPNEASEDVPPRGAPTDLNLNAGGKPPLGSQASFAHLAFALGTDPAVLGQANQQTGGLLVPLLLQRLELPVVEIHADLAPEAITRRQESYGERLVGTLAEMGLIHRPLHLWIGPSALTDCISPYARDLREVLVRWAWARPQHLGEDLEVLPAPLGEDAIYAIAHDFIATDERLAQERIRADRTVGILRASIDGVPVEIIDLGRADASTVDARLPTWQVPNPAPVLVRMPPPTGDTRAAALRMFLAAAGSQVRGITFISQGLMIGAAPGSLVLPHLMVRWAGEDKLTLPCGNALQPSALHGYADTMIRRGAVLSAASSSLIDRPELTRLQQELNVCAVEVGGDAVLRAIGDALWRGQLSADCNVGWACVGVRYTRTARPSLASTASLSALAIATLRHLVHPQEPTGTPSPEPRASSERTSSARPREPLRPSPRAIRIKA